MWSVGTVPKLELEWANPDDVAVSEWRLRLDDGATEQSTVGAVEVVKNSGPLDAVDSDARVPARHIRVIQPDRARRITPDDVVAFKKNKLAVPLDEPVA